MIKKIGVLTSGGDCAGLNAVIRAITLRAVNMYGWEVCGILHSTHGLLASPPTVCTLTPASLNPGMIRQGGTILGSTNKGNPLAFLMPDGSVVDRSKAFYEGYKALSLDALISIGGDGSLGIMRQLAQKFNLNMIGVPKTIDNDLAMTEVSIGFSTAVDVATEALDRLQPTAASHDRVMILQVMGRDAGHIALNAGIAGGADIILIPEIPYKMDNILKRIRALRDNAKNFALIVIAEAVKKPDGKHAVVDDRPDRARYSGIAEHFCDIITRETGAETRATVLGHVQRGGSPDARDRVLASAFGVHAVDLIAKGRFDRMVAWQNREVTDVPIEQAIHTPQIVDIHGTLVNTARGLGICLGDLP